MSELSVSQSVREDGQNRTLLISKLERLKKNILIAKIFIDSIENWSPKVGEQQVANGMEQAFGLWSKYSGLRFRRVFQPDADILVAFGSGYHGDAFPFDGPGNVLAHAFYPYAMIAFGGDIHFDNDENWRENASNLNEGLFRRQRYKSFI